MRLSDAWFFVLIAMLIYSVENMFESGSEPKHEPTNAELFEERNALVRSMNADAEDRRIETAGTVILLTCSTYALGCASSATLFLGLLQDTSAKAARVQEIDATILDRVNRGRRSPLRPVWTNKE